MKQIIKVELKTRRADYSAQKTDLLAVGVCKDGKKSEKILEGIDEKVGGAIANIKKLGDFKAEPKTCAVLYGGGKTEAKRILLVGLGESRKVTANTIREAAAIVGSKAVDLKAEQTVLALHQCLERRLNVEKTGQAIAEGVCFGSYRYDEFVTKEENGRPKELSFEIVDSIAVNVRVLSKG
ncbi:MAG: M17 family peptidase N-terminal domain-containing protein, partial [Planctomycetota bacterium]